MYSKRNVCMLSVFSCALTNMFYLMFPDAGRETLSVYMLELYIYIYIYVLYICVFWEAAVVFLIPKVGNCVCQAT